MPDGDSRRPVGALTRAAVRRGWLLPGERLVLCPACSPAGCPRCNQKGYLIQRRGKTDA